MAFYTKEDKQAFEANNRASAMQTSINATAQLLSAKSQISGKESKLKDIEELIFYFYNLIMDARQDIAITDEQKQEVARELKDKIGDFK
ncbi:MAG: hypothetical protein BWY74_00826 [Firmicutes bacterium ADurb.Bin419]|nr:MAG: hypothetical protein BWY74_00826 [Firmicutes bacterium ADurb.Bin419]